MLFISHNHEDEAAAQALYESLSVRGVDCWLASKAVPLGGPIARAMSLALETASHLVVLWSGSSAESAHVWNEIDAFYMKCPDGNRLLFYRLDQTPVPTLYAARLHLDATSRIAVDSEVIGAWVTENQLPALGTSMQAVEPTTPDAKFLRNFAPGPLVELRYIPRELVQAYATILASSADSQLALGAALQMREEVEPPGTEGILINLSCLPDIAHGPFAFWYAAFAEAFRHGPRMVMALLSVQPDDLFPLPARQARAKLIAHLRKISEQSRPQWDLS